MPKMNIGSYSDLLASLFCLYFQNIVYVGRKLPRQMSCTVSNDIMPPCRNADCPASLFAVQIVYDGHQSG